jgi:hypothetical protein
MGVSIFSKYPSYFRGGGGGGGGERRKNCKDLMEFAKTLTLEFFFFLKKNLTFFKKIKIKIGILKILTRFNEKS